MDGGSPPLRLRSQKISERVSSSFGSFEPLGAGSGGKGKERSVGEGSEERDGDSMARKKRKQRMDGKSGGGVEQ